MPATLNYDNLQTELNSLMDSLTCDTVKAQEDYEQLYHAIANGQERPDNVTICNILRNIDKTPDDLKNDVQWRINRSKMIEEYRLIPQLEAEQDKALAEVRKLNTEQKRLEEEYELKKQPYRVKANQAEQQLRELQDHRDTLIRECRCKALVVGLQNAEFQRDKAADEYNQLNVDIYRLRGRIGEANDVLHKCSKMIYFDGMAEQKQAAHQTIKESEAEIGRLQKQVKQLEAKLANHNAEVERIQEQMLRE